MANSDDLFLAILALDSYNRGCQSSLTLLFDAELSLEERSLKEQFAP